MSRMHRRRMRFPPLSTMHRPSVIRSAISVVARNILSRRTSSMTIRMVCSRSIRGSSPNTNNENWISSGMDTLSHRYDHRHISNSRGRGQAFGTMNCVKRFPSRVSRLVRRNAKCDCERGATYMTPAREAINQSLHCNRPS